MVEHLAFNQLVGGSIPPRPTTSKDGDAGMTENRTVIAQFCDDFRQEIGNKFSLMGCYGTDLYVPQFPITLPKLCVCECAHRVKSLSAATLRP